MSERVSSSGRKLPSYIWVAGILLLIVALVLVGTPFALKWSLERWLADQGAVEIEIDDIDFNPFSGQVAVKSMSYRAEDDRTSAEGLVLEVDWSNLFSRQIFLRKIVLRDASVAIRRTESEGLFLAAIAVGGTRAVEAAETVETAAGWQFGFGGLEIENVRLHYVDPLLDYQFRIPWVSLGEMAMWQADEDTKLRARLELEDASLEVDGTLRPFAERFRMDLDVKALRIPVAPEMAAMASDSFEEARGNYDLSGKLSVRQTDAGFEVDFDGGFDIREFSATGAGLVADLETVSWDGNLALKTGDETISVSVAGRSEVGPASIAVDVDGRRSSLSALTWDGDIDFESDSQAQRLELSGDLNGSTLQMEVSPTASGEGDDGFNLALETLSLTTEALTLDRVAAGQQLAWRGQTGLAGAEFAAGEQSGALAGLNWEGTVETGSLEDSMEWSADGGLQLTGIEAADGNGHDATVDKLEWEGRAGSAADSFAGLGLNGLASIESLALRRDGWQVGRIASLKGSLAEDATGGRMTVRDVTAAGVDLLQRDEAADTGEPGQVVSIKEITVSEIGLADGRVAVGDVGIGAADIWLQTASDGKLEIRRMTGSNQDARGQTAAPTTPVSGDAVDDGLQFSIAAIRTTEEAKITYLDLTVQPTVRLEFTEMTLEVGRLDTEQPETDTGVKLQTRLDRYGRLAYDGTLRPLAAQLSANGTGEVRGMDLKLFDGYARRNTGYRIDSGNLRADVDIDIQSGAVDSHAAMIISQLDVEAVVAEEDDDTVADLGMPLGAALDLLKDDDDTITLDVPMTGNIDEMKLGLGDAFRTVLRKGLVTGIRTAATTMFAPLWPVLAVSKLVDVAGAAKFKAVTFPAGDASLAADQTSYLSDVAKLLADRPKISLEICGRTAIDDLPVLLPDANPDALSDEQTAALSGLALTRQQAVKDFLLDTGIEAYRVATCAVAEHPQGIEGLPRVDVGL